MEINFFSEEDTQKGKYLIFSLDKEEYGIEIKYITEIIGIQEITQVPELPLYVKGVINLRGKIIPVMDVRLRFKKLAREYDDRTCIVIVEIDDVSVGLVVDRVSEVVNISEEEISKPPVLSKSSQKNYIKGIGKLENEAKILLAVDRLINMEEKSKEEEKR